jgi:hypothetical protein
VGPEPQRHAAVGAAADVKPNGPPLVVEARVPGVVEPHGPGLGAVLVVGKARHQRLAPRLDGGKALDDAVGVDGVRRGQDREHLVAAEVRTPSGSGSARRRSSAAASARAAAEPRSLPEAASRPSRASARSHSMVPISDRSSATPGSAAGTGATPRVPGRSVRARTTGAALGGAALRQGGVGLGEEDRRIAHQGRRAETRAGRAVGPGAGCGAGRHRPPRRRPPRRQGRQRRRTGSSGTLPVPAPAGTLRSPAAAADWNAIRAGMRPSRGRV